MSHDYEPLKWQKSIGYRVDKSRCRAAVPEEGRGVGFRQCSRKPANGERYCKHHTPEAIQARRDANSKRWQERAEQEKRRNMRWHGAPFIAALREIAKGHNDPRSLAHEVLQANGFEADA